MSDSGFDPTIGALNTSLNLRLFNQNVISGNIANADTPGYKAKVMEFEGALRDALGTGDGVHAEATAPGHMGHKPTDPVNPEVYDDPSGIESLDGNTVDRANDLARMSENQLLYEASAQLLKHKLGMLKYGITEGGGNR